VEFNGDRPKCEEDRPQYSNKPVVIQNVRCQAFDLRVNNENARETIQTGRGKKQNDKFGKRVAERQECTSQRFLPNSQKTSGVKRNAQEQQFLNTILIIALLAVVTVVPAAIVCQVWQTIVNVEKLQLITRIAYAVSWAIFSFNFAVNPFIYCFRLKRYRKTFEMVYCCTN
jgi:hypothetical protein